MKKISILLCSVLLLTFLFGGCASEKAENVVVGQYLGLSVTRSSDSVTDSDISSAVSSTLNKYASSSSITTPIQKGDTASINYVGRIDGQTFTGGTGTKDLVIGSGSFISGFEDGLIGHTAGETVTLDLTFPTTYSASPDLAGKAVTFEVTINKVTRSTVPELTDEQVQKMSDYGTVDKFLSALRERLAISKKDSVDSDVRNDLWSQIVESSTVASYPDGEVSSEAAALYENYSSIAYTNNAEMYSYIAGYYGYDKETFDSKINSTAESTVKARLVLHKIADQEGITVSDEDYTSGLASYKSIYSSYTQSEIVEAFGGEDSLRDQLLWEKVMDLVVENAEITQG